MYNVSISKGNRKLGGIPSFSLPPVITCAHCEQCSKKCYALRMQRLYKHTRQAWAGNLQAWKECPQAVKSAITTAAYTSQYFRFFVGGDIPDQSFLAMMCDIADTVSRCRFLTFTKKYELVNEYITNGGKIPQNLKIIFSCWGEQSPANPHKLPMSNVIFKNQEIPQNVKICGGNCTECVCRGVGCWELADGETIYFYEH